MASLVIHRSEAAGILASALGEDLWRRGHEVHFISSDRPFRLPENTPRVHFHPVAVGGYQLFKYPDYTLPLSVKMAEVSLEYELDVLHVHYAVPHATAALLANAMLSGESKAGCDNDASWDGYDFAGP